MTAPTYVPPDAVSLASEACGGVLVSVIAQVCGVTREINFYELAISLPGACWIVVDIFHPDELTEALAAHAVLCAAFTALW